MNKADRDALRAAYPATIEYGSKEHAALLGIEGQEDEAAKHKLELALEAGEPVIHGKKVPINRRNYDRDEHIMDGWARRGR